VTHSAWGPGSPEEGEETPRIRPFLGAAPGGPPPAGDPAADGGGPAPRPFVLTSGRVLGDSSDIGVETQVTTRCDRSGRPLAPLYRLTPEQQAIILLCLHAVSVAEISARLHLHLDVTKILVDDLRVAGYLTVHVTDAVNPDDPDTILRVIRGLRALT
jgi:uncharacterized protein DUF742